MVYGQEINPAEEVLVASNNPMASLRTQLSISGNMLASIVAVFGISYYICMQLKYDPSTVSYSLFIV